MHTHIVTSTSCVYSQAWALAGVAVYGVLSALNLFWFYKLMQLALQAGPKKASVKAVAAVQASPSVAAATDITAAAGHTALSEVNKLLMGNSNENGTALQHSKQSTAAWVHHGKVGLTGRLHRFRPAIAGLEPRLSDSSDAPMPAKMATAQCKVRVLSTYGPAILASWEKRSSASAKGTMPDATEVNDSAALQPHSTKVRSRMRRPPLSPFAAMAADS